MIEIKDYWMGRDVRFAAELTPEIETNAAETIRRVNLLLDRAALDGVYPGIDPRTGTEVSSGWRPAAINEHTKNAASGSKHLTARAEDVRDTQQRSLARWCVSHQDVLAEIGLWIEDPQWCPTWVHFQTVPPGSGLRVYVPSTAPAICAKLPEQEALA